LFTINSQFIVENINKANIIEIIIFIPITY
jgi:hypothetical protein